jgi:hypothetical protein
MAKTKTIKNTQPVTESETTTQDYSKMTAVDLKKLLDIRKIEGRSKLTKKETMVKVLELFDQNPDDKSAITALVAELSTPRKRNTSKSENNDSDQEKNESKSKKLTKTEISEEEESPKEISGEITKEKPKRNPRSKKEVSTEPEAEKPKKTRSKKEVSTGSEEPSVVVDDQGSPLKETLVDEKEPSSVVSEDIQSARSESETTQEDVEIIQKTSEEVLKRGKNLPGAVKVLPDFPVKEGKKEVDPEPTAHQPEVVDLEDDPSMQEVFSLTRDILRRMKYLAREAHENEKFKKSWIDTLMKLKGDFDQELELLGATIDE